MKKISNFFLKDKWLSKILKKNTYTIINPKKKKLEYPINSGFIFSKIDKNKKKIINFFLLNNFKKINSNIIFEKKISNKEKLDCKNIRKAKKKDLKKIQMIASKNLTKSRFNLDKSIKKRDAESIKKAWVSNFFKRKRGDALHVLEIKKEIVGFVLLIFKKKRLIIDLIALSKNQQNKGYGKKLVNQLELIYRNKFSKILVGTQSNNIQSIKFYNKVGFKRIREFVVLHKHL